MATLSPEMTISPCTFGVVIGWSPSQIEVVTPGLPFFNKGYWLVTALLIALGMLLVVSACGLNGWHIPVVSDVAMGHWYNVFNFTAPR